jgi:hypothetical protein
MAQRGLFARGRDTVRVEVELKQPAIPEKKSLGQIRIEFATGYSTQYDLKEGDTYLDLKQHCLNLLVNEVRSCLDETKNGGARIVFISDEQEDNVPITAEVYKKMLNTCNCGLRCFFMVKKEYQKTFFKDGNIIFKPVRDSNLEKLRASNNSQCRIM